MKNLLTIFFLVFALSIGTAQVALLDQDVGQTAFLDLTSDFTDLSNDQLVMQYSVVELAEQDTYLVDLVDRAPYYGTNNSIPITPGTWQSDQAVIIPQDDYFQGIKIPYSNWGAQNQAISIPSPPPGYSVEVKYVPDN